MSAGGFIDSVIIFRILKKLTTPWEKTAAFKAGVIDKNGTVLVKTKDRTTAQKKTVTILDRLVFNLKRLLARAPGGSSTMASYIAALSLIKEYVEDQSNPETVNVLMEKLENHNIKTYREYDLSTYEGFMDAFEDELAEMSVSGASFSGSLSGSGSNNSLNDTGMAGADPTMSFKNKRSKKKKVINKILNNRL